MLSLVRTLSLFCLGMYYGYSKFDVTIPIWKVLVLFLVYIITSLMIAVKNGKIIIEAEE
jgi:hypothetical protein